MYAEKIAGIILMKESQKIRRIFSRGMLSYILCSPFIDP